MVKGIQNFTAELKGTQVWSWLIATTDRKQLWLVPTVYLDTLHYYITSRLESQAQSAGDRMQSYYKLQGVIYSLQHLYWKYTTPNKNLINTKISSVQCVHLMVSDQVCRVQRASIVEVF